MFLKSLYLRSLFRTGFHQNQSQIPIQRFLSRNCRNLLTTITTHQNRTIEIKSLQTYRLDIRSYAQLSKSLALPLSTTSKQKPNPSTSPAKNSSKSNSKPPSLASNPEGAKKPGSSKISSFFDIPQDAKNITALKGIKEDPAEWRMVYRFSHIRTARVVQRFKLYQTAFSCLFVAPVSLGCFVQGVANDELLLLTTVGCGLACTMLYVMGNFFSKLIGYIYVTDKDPDVVRVAHMTFWGKRKDEIFLKTDFVPFSELADNVLDVYIQIKRYSEPERILYLCLKFGEVHGKEELEDIFGQIR